MYLQVKFFLLQVSTKRHQGLSVNKSAPLPVAVEVSLFSPNRWPVFIHFERCPCSAACMVGYQFPFGYHQHFISMLFHHFFGYYRKLLHIGQALYIFQPNASLCIQPVIKRRFPISIPEYSQKHFFIPPVQFVRCHAIHFLYLDHIRRYDEWASEQIFSGFF